MEIEKFYDKYFGTGYWELQYKSHIVEFANQCVELQKSTNSAMVPCPKHNCGNDCKLTPAWICRKLPCKIDRAQHQ